MRNNRVRLVVILLVLACVRHSWTWTGSRKTENLNWDTTPFLLLDLDDGMCLGPDGQFGPCDPRSLWVLTGGPDNKIPTIVNLLEPDPARMCLGRAKCHSGESSVGVFKCSHCGTKHINFFPTSVSGLFIVSQDNNKNCLVRGKGPLKNSVGMQRCEKGGTPLRILESALHKAGVHLLAADGQCFDGERFRTCDDRDKALRWGIGFDFNKAEPSRQIFSFFNEGQCLVHSNSKIGTGPCENKGAGGWGLKEGKLLHWGTHCVGRKSDDVAIMVPCAQGFEHMSMAVPQTMPPEQVHVSEREAGSFVHGRGRSGMMSRHI